MGTILVPLTFASQKLAIQTREEKKYSLGMEGLEGILMFRLGWTTWSNF